MPNTAKYMRWYVADKDGKVVNINGWSASGSSSSYKQKITIIYGIIMIMKRRQVTNER